MSKWKYAVGGLVSALALDAHFGGVTAPAALWVHDHVLCSGQDVINGSMGKCPVSLLDLAVGAGLAAWVYSMKRRHCNKKSTQETSKGSLEDNISTIPRSHTTKASVALALSLLGLGWVYTHTVNNNRDLPFAPSPESVQHELVANRVELHKSNVATLEKLVEQFPGTATPASPVHVETVRQAAYDAFVEYAPGVNPPPLKNSVLTLPSRGAFFNIAFGEAVLRPGANNHESAFLGTYAHEMAHRISANECRTQLLGWEILERAFEADPSPRMLSALVRMYARGDDIRTHPNVVVEKDFTQLWSDDGLTYGHATLARGLRAGVLSNAVERNNQLDVDVVLLDSEVPRISTAGGRVRVTAFETSQGLHGVYLNDRYHKIKPVDLSAPVDATLTTYSFFARPQVTRLTLAPKYFPDAVGELVSQEFSGEKVNVIFERDLIEARHQWLISQGWTKSEFVGVRVSPQGIIACYKIPKAYRIAGFMLPERQSYASTQRK